MNKDLKALLGLDFDQFGRIYAAKNAVEKIRKKGQKFRILDVGGYKGNTTKLFPGDEVLIVDQYSIKAKNYQKANALNLPFKDDEFDIVLAFDVFEHIAEKDRVTFLKELTRTAGVLTVIAAPFKSRLTEKAENLSNDYYKYLANKDHPWLIEHIENSLPHENTIQGFLKKSKLAYRVVQNNNIVLWNYMQHYTLLTSLGVTPQNLAETNIFYNTHIADLESPDEESYRKVYLIGELTKSVSVKIPKDSLETQLDLTHKIFRDIAELALEKNRLIAAQAKTIATLNNSITTINGSISWKLTKPLRAIRNRQTKKK